MALYRMFADTSKKCLKDDPKELNRLVRNIYKVLMSRGMKGCYVFSSNQDVTNYLNKIIKHAERKTQEI